MNTQNHTIYSNTTRLRLTKSPNLFVISTFISVVVLLGFISMLTWINSDVLTVRLGMLGFCSALFLIVLRKLFKIADAFVLTDMVIIKPYFGKKLITPLQGIIIKNSFVSKLLPVCLVHIRLDGKKSIHYFYGKCDQLMQEKIKIDDYLSQLNKNKKVNHKPGSVSSVA